jgi:hypothetical protein
MNSEHNWCRLEKRWLPFLKAAGCANSYRCVARSAAATDARSWYLYFQAIPYQQLKLFIIARCHDLTSHREIENLTHFSYQGITGKRFLKKRKLCSDQSVLRNFVASIAGSIKHFNFPPGGGKPLGKNPTAEARHYNIRDQQRQGTFVARCHANRIRRIA